MPGYRHGKRASPHREHRDVEVLPLEALEQHGTDLGCDSERTFLRATAVTKCALEKKKMLAGIIFKMATIAVLGGRGCNNFPLWFSNFV